MVRKKESEKSKTVSRHISTSASESVSAAHHSTTSEFQFDFESWQKSPKTDYTYARTITYDRLSPLKHVSPPNMSRTGLHQRSGRTSVVQSLFTEHHVLKEFIESANVESSAEMSAYKSQQATDSKQSRRKSRRSIRVTELDSREDNDLSDEDGTADSNTVRRELNFSVTRSGTRYHGESQTRLSSLVSTGQDEVDQSVYEKNTSQNYAQYSAKQREYAGLSMGVKERDLGGEESAKSYSEERRRHRIELYGLDNGAREFSDDDNEASSTRAHAAESRTSLLSQDGDVRDHVSYTGDSHIRQRRGVTPGAAFRPIHHFARDAVLAVYNFLRYVIVTILYLIWLLFMSPVLLYRRIFRSSHDQASLRLSEYRSFNEDRYSSSISGPSTTPLSRQSLTSAFPSSTTMSSYSLSSVSTTSSYTTRNSTQTTSSNIALSGRSEVSEKGRLITEKSLTIESVDGSAASVSDIKEGSQSADVLNFATSSISSIATTSTGDSSVVSSTREGRRRTAGSLSNDALAMSSSSNATLSTGTSSVTSSTRKGRRRTEAEAELPQERRPQHAMSTRSRRSMIVTTEAIGEESAGAQEHAQSVSSSDSNRAVTQNDGVNVDSVETSYTHIHAGDMTSSASNITRRSSRRLLENESVVRVNHEQTQQSNSRLITDWLDTEAAKSNRDTVDASCRSMLTKITADTSSKSVGSSIETSAQFSLVRSLITGIYTFNMAVFRSVTRLLRLLVVSLLGVISILLAPVSKLTSLVYSLWSTQRTHEAKHQHFAEVHEIQTTSHVTDVEMSVVGFNGVLNRIFFDTWFGRQIYSFIAYIFVVDTWLLKRRRCGLCCLLPLLLLLPLFLAGGFYMQQDEATREQLRHVVFGSWLQKTQDIPGCPVPNLSPGSSPRVGLSEAEVSAIIAQQLQLYKQEGTTVTDRLHTLYSALVLGQDKLQAEVTSLRTDLSAHAQLPKQTDKTQGQTQNEHSTQILLISDRLVKIESLLKELETSTGNLKVQGEADRALWQGHVGEWQAALSATKSDRQATLDDQEVALRALEARVAAAERDSAETRVRLADSRPLGDETLAQLAAMYISKSELDSLRASFNSRLTEMAGASDANLKSHIDESAHQTQARMQQVLSDLGALSAKLEEYGAGLRALRGDLDTLAARQASSADEEKEPVPVPPVVVPAEVSEDISRLQAQLAKLSEDIAVISANCCSKAAQVGLSEEQLAGLAADRQQLTELRTRVDHMTQQLQQAATAGGLSGSDVYKGLSEEQISGMIATALATYHADRTGKPDFALESAGGSVVSTRCSETYPVRTAQVSVWGIPLWYTSSSPRSVIQPEVYPGQCWAMAGSSGFLVLQLSGYIHLTEFSYEHIPRALAPNGNITSAPKDFSVWGLEYIKDFPGTNLGNYTYQESGTPLQTFPVQVPGLFSVIELRVHSNWGHPAFTCLYRFRVHGRLEKYVTGPPKENKEEL